MHNAVIFYLFFFFSGRQEDLNASTVVMKRQEKFAASALSIYHLGGLITQMWIQIWDTLSSHLLKHIAAMPLPEKYFEFIL